MSRTCEDNYQYPRIKQHILHFAQLVLGILIAVSVGVLRTHFIEMFIIAVDVWR